VKEKLVGKHKYTCMHKEKRRHGSVP